MDTDAVTNDLHDTKHLILGAEIGPSIGTSAREPFIAGIILYGPISIIEHSALFLILK